MTDTDQRNPIGRPSKYGPAIVADICERIANGMSLREICRADDMPDKATVLRWLERFSEFRDQYAHAREVQADHFAEEILEIADDASNDWITRKVGEDEVEAANHEHISRSKLRVDARKWLMAKMAPKKYGDRQQIEHSGGMKISHEEALDQLE